MAYEENIQIEGKDKNGNKIKRYPITKIGNVFNPETGKTLDKILGNTSSETYVYRCTGTNDDLAIQNLINDFFSKGTAKTMKLIVTGNMGLQSNPAENRCIYINATKSRSAICCIDMTDCNIPDISYPVATTFLYIDSTSVVMRVIGAVVSGASTDPIVVNSGTVVFEHVTIHGHFAFKTGVNSNVAFNFCNITYTSGSVSNLYGNSIFNNCKFGLGLYVYGKCQLNNCDISSSGGQPLRVDTSQPVVVNSCILTSTSGAAQAVCISSISSGVNVSILQSRIVGSNYGIYVEAVNTLSNIILIANQIKGGIQDIDQVSPANTVKWHVDANLFSKSGININGLKNVGYATASQYIKFDQFANKFNQTIS